ncbi:peroxiredoxin, partial [Enterococcus faecium]|nr:peroxiredoxin [Enterococcus faecium]
MSLIGKKIEEFNVQAYHQGEFLEISEKDLMGNWSILCFYP